MPQQEVFFEHAAGNRRIQVPKAYDHAYARELFDERDAAAQTILRRSLDIKQTYDLADLSSPTVPDRADFLWKELLDSAREDVRQNPSVRSFFVVDEIRSAAPQKSLYVSPDWPSAKSSAENLLAEAS